MVKEWHVVAAFLLGMAAGSVLTYLVLTGFHSSSSGGKLRPVLENREEWELVKDPKTGRLLKIIVHRRVKR